MAAVRILVDVLFVVVEVLTDEQLLREGASEAVIKSCK